MTNHLHRERAERPKESPTVAPKNKTAAPKASLYEEITARIIADLEAGTFPWAQPWGASPGNAALGLPRNAATGKSYSGINVLILWGRLFDRGFTSQSWLTIHQALNLGGAVRKGEHGVSICYADKFIPKATEATARAAKPHQARAMGTARARRCRSCGAISSSTSRNARTCRTTVAPRPPYRDARSYCRPRRLRERRWPIFAPAERTPFIGLRKTRSTFRRSPLSSIKSITTGPCFMSWGTGPGTRARLGRGLTGSFGSKDYANEELVAEITAAFVCAALSIQPTVRHADYLGNWLSVLRSDNRAIFRAASKASKAADFLLAVRKSEPAMLPDGEATR